MLFLTGRGGISYTLLGYDMKTFWQHTNGLIYVVESDTFGQITGAAGPVDLDMLRDPSEYKCGPGILAWIKRSIVEHKLGRINPALSEDAPAAPPRKPQAPPPAKPKTPIVPVKSCEPEKPPDPIEQERARRKKFAWSSSYRL